MYDEEKNPYGLAPDVLGAIKMLEGFIEIIPADCFVVQVEFGKKYEGNVTIRGQRFYFVLISRIEFTELKDFLPIRHGEDYNELFELEIKCHEDENVIPLTPFEHAVFCSFILQNAFVVYDTSARINKQNVQLLIEDQGFVLTADNIENLNDPKFHGAFVPPDLKYK